MKKQQGIILVITLIFLMLFSLFAISALESSLETKKLVNLQTERSKLFSETEQQLQLAENQITQRNIKLSIPSQLLTDQKILTDQIPPGILQQCTNTEIQQKCYFIELLDKENCITEMNQQVISVLFYRVTARVSMRSLGYQCEILQSIYISLPTTIQRCVLSNSLTETKHYLYAGRQSWREIN